MDRASLDKEIQRRVISPWAHAAELRAAGLRPPGCVIVSGRKSSGRTYVALRIADMLGGSVHTVDATAEDVSVEDLCKIMDAPGESPRTLVVDDADAAVSSSSKSTDLAPVLERLATSQDSVIIVVTNSSTSVDHRIKRIGVWVSVPSNTVCADRADALRVMCARYPGARVDCGRLAARLHYESDMRAVSDLVDAAFAFSLERTGVVSGLSDFDFDSAMAERPTYFARVCAKYVAPGYSGRRLDETSGIISSLSDGAVTSVAIFGRDKELARSLALNLALDIAESEDNVSCVFFNSMWQSILGTSVSKIVSANVMSVRDDRIRFACTDVVVVDTLEELIRLSKSGKAKNAANLNAFANLINSVVNPRSRLVLIYTSTLSELIMKSVGFHTNFAVYAGDDQEFVLDLYC